MSVFKCKMCGGALEITPGSSVAVCTFCGTKQTLPRLDDEQRANLYDRANHFRRNNDYDKAMALYEQLLAADKTDAEAYWSILLCKYGVEYVEDPATHKMVPTINRAQYTSIFADEDYKAAIQYADGYQRDVYEQEAKTIDAIQREIIAVSQKEEPFDVFISYKETDASGRRTLDSVLAQDIYYQLTKEGYKVFFSRITLESKLGTAYEPYIFAALNTAKVMIVVGTRQEYFNAVWVRNEWSRFLGLIKNGKSKILIPAYRDMDPYDLPEEFSHLQALDMSKLGFIQDLIHGIEKIVKKSAPVVEPTIVVGASANTDALVKRAYMSIEDRDYDKADSFAEQILNINPELADAYIIKLLIECKARSIEELRHRTVDISKSPNYRRALKYADDEPKKKLEEIQKANAEYFACQPIYDKAKKAMEAKNWGEAVELLSSIAQYKDSATLLEQCKLENERNLYEIAKVAMLARDWQTAITFLSHIPEYKDSIVLIEQCKEQAELARKETIYAKALKVVSSSFANENALRQCISDLRSLDGYKDSNEQIYKLEQRIEELKEQQRIAAERAAKAQHAKKIAGLVVAIVLVLTIIIAVLTVKVFIPLSKYNQARKLVQAGEYEEAKLIFQNLEGYKESEGHLSMIEARAQVEESLVSMSLNETIQYLRNYEGINSVLTYNAGDGFFDGDPNKHSTQSIGIAIAEEAVPTKEGYTFSGWSRASYTIDYDASRITAYIELVPLWEATTYDISYELNGADSIASSPSSYTIESNTIRIPDPSRIGYIFQGWLINDSETPIKSYTIRTGTFGDQRLSAVWVSTEYVYTLVDGHGGSLLSSEEYQAYYGEICVLPSLSLDGAEFLGWYLNGTRVAPMFVWYYPEDEVFSAAWNYTNYSISYNLDGGNNNSSNPAKYTRNDQISLVAPTKTGYSFAGWAREDGVIISQIEKGSVGNIRLKATWKPLVFEYVLDDTFNGSIVSSTSYTIEYGQECTLPTLSKTGMSFAGWKHNGITQNNSFTWNYLTKQTFVASWAYIDYTITYNLNGGTNAVSNPTSYTIDDSFMLSGASKAGYYFRGWAKNDNSIISSLSKGTFGDISLTAQWKPITFTYTLDDGYDGAILSESQYSVAYDQRFYLPVIEGRGLTFLGWYLNGTCYSNGGSSFKWQFVTTQTFVARWAHIEYPITYHLNGGTNSQSNPSSYIVIDDFDFASPTKKGYTFDGWIDDNTNDKVTGVDYNSIGDISLSATWKANYYTVYYTPNNGDNTFSTEVLFDSLVNHPTVSRIGYTFAGWYNGSVLYTDSTWKDDSTVYLNATWTPNSDTHYKVYVYLENADDSAFSLGPILDYYGTTDTSVVVDIPTYSHFIRPSKPTITISPDGSSYSICYYSRELQTISLYPNNGDLAYTIITKYSSHVTIEPAEREGYTFGGWYTNADLTVAFDMSSPVVNDISLFASWEEETPTADFSFSNNAITQYKGEDSVVVIPSYYANSLIVNIGTSMKNNTSVTSVTLPVEVSTLSDEAFSGCVALETITNLEQVTAIGENAFRDCAEFDDFSLGNSLSSIGVGAFKNCTSLIEIVVPNSVSTIGSGVFSGCSSLESITIPFIGDRIVLAGSDESHNSFGYIFGMEEYEGGVATRQMSGIDYYIPNTLRNVVVTGGDVLGSAFINCTYLSSIILPDSATIIADNAFRGCDGITTLTIPENVTYIGNYAINCANLTELYLGSKIQSFYVASLVDLKTPFEIYYDGSKSDWEKITAYYDSFRFKGKLTIHCTKTGYDIVYQRA